MAVLDVELVAFAGTADILQIGMLADEASRRRHGARTTFVRVAHVAVEPGGPIHCPPAAGEIRIDGIPSTRAAAVARVGDVAAVAGGVPLSGYTLDALEHLASREGVTLRSLLEELQAAGLELVAEAPFDRLQSPRRAIEEVNISGLALARLTVHHWPGPDVLPLFKAVADLQREVGVIRTFAPLPRAINPAVPTTGYDDVKRVALARLVVDNIPSIQVDWSLYGPKLAQVALTVGADDVDGISAEEDLGEGRRRAPLSEILRNIHAAGREPVERDGRFDSKPT
jgi:aminodeoxyfutalosine synthase